jgi:hypothetical protein
MNGLYIFKAESAYPLGAVYIENPQSDSHLSGDRSEKVRERLCLIIVLDDKGFALGRISDLFYS